MKIRKLKLSEWELIAEMADQADHELNLKEMREGEPLPFLLKQRRDDLRNINRIARDIVNKKS